MRTELAIIRQCKKLKIATKMDGLIKPNELTADYPNSTTYVIVQTNELTLNYPKCTKSHCHIVEIEKGKEAHLGCVWLSSR